MTLNDLMNAIPYDTLVSIRDRRHNVLASNYVFSIKSAGEYKKNLKEREVYQMMVEDMDYDTRLVILVY